MLPPVSIIAISNAVHSAILPNISGSFLLGADILPNVSLDKKMPEL